MKFTQKQIVILAGAGLLIVVFGIVIILNTRHTSTTQQTKLSVWGTEDIATFNNLVGKYGEVSYTQVDPGNYQSRLLSAFAAGSGPDVFEIGNRELPKWKSALAPMPATLTASYGPVYVQNAFPDVVSQDFVSGGAVYALPLSVDTLAIYYNRDLFNSAGIAFPPKTWSEFQDDIAKLRNINTQGQLIQAAAAIGGSGASIANAADLLSLLMLQNGTKMMSDDFSSAVFATSGSGDITPGLAAFNFYLQFANPASPYYTWNNSLGDALQSFIQGKTAILFDYASALKVIKQKAPFLNLGIAPMPQPANATIAINYPSYHGFAAARAGQVSAAWNFILYLTTTQAVEKMYVTQTGEPPAQRTEIQADLADPNLSIFAAQALTAKSWHEIDDQKISSIFNAAIQSVLIGSLDSGRALTQAQGQVNATIAQQTGP